MSYKQESIKNIIRDINFNKIYLPAIQRKFVWGKPQIQLLFDSLMRGYPIGTFLFWSLHKDKAKEYVFYDFLKSYDEREPYNVKKEGVFFHEEITGVLDGQQRLSSMYIGLMGTHTEKEPYKHSSNPTAYQPKILNLNLLSLPYRIEADGSITLTEEKDFEFRFISVDEMNSSSRKRLVEVNGSGTKAQMEEQVFWFRVGDVLGWEIDPDRDHYFAKFLSSCTTDYQRNAVEGQKRQIMKCLASLESRLNTEPLISYFEIVKDDLEDILKIFVRVNSGGTVLNKSDLLFSTIVATWSNGREVIETLQRTINSKGDKFNFTNEYLMRCCLVLTDAPVVYKVNSFKSDNVQKIRNDWRRISKAITDTVDLLVEYGFNGNLLTSQNATIIIAYYLYKGGETDTQSKAEIRKYLVHALLKNLYSTSQDQLITKLRDSLRADDKTKPGSYTILCKKFVFKNLLSLDLPGRQSFAVTELDIDLFLESKKGPASFFVLTMLYPGLRYAQVQFHQDHIHPAASFAKEKFQEMGLPSDQWNNWQALRDCVPNLQLLEGRQNESKNATPLKKWVFEELTEANRDWFQKTNFFPANVGLDFENFINFFEGRKALLKTELMKVLALNNNMPSMYSRQPTVDDDAESI